MSTSITFYGHATLGIESEGQRLIVDPFFAPNSPVAQVTAEQVDADFILLTHGHEDHVADAVALAQRTDALVIANFEIADWLEGQGVEKVHPLHIGGGNNFPFGRAKMTIAHHGSGLPDGSYGGNPAGFLLNLNDGADIYISGDTALTYDMRLIGEAGGVDVAVLCIGDNFTMGPEDAVVAAEFVKAKTVIPVHYNTWPYIEQDPQRFAAMAQESGIECAVLDVGGVHTV